MLWMMLLEGGLKDVQDYIQDSHQKIKRQTIILQVVTENNTTYTTATKSSFTQK